MLTYIVGLAAAGLVGSFVFQGNPERKNDTQIKDCAPDVRDYRIPELVDEEKELAHR